MYARRAGSVLLFSLVIVGMVTILTQQLVKSVAVGVSFSTAMVRREQSEMLALGGITIAIAQLQKGLEPQRTRGVVSDEQKKQEKGFPFASYIKHIVPLLGRWQRYDLVKAYDGIDGRIDVCMSAEAGKIPTSLLYDEKKKSITALGQALFKNFQMKKIIGQGEFLKQLTSFYKKNSATLLDVTALAPLAQHFSVPLFYEPHAYEEKKKYDDGPLKPIAVQDLFTTWYHGKKVSPLLMSDALCAVIGVRRPLQSDKQKRAKRYEQLAEQYKNLKRTKGEEMWKGLQLIFDTKPKLSKELLSFFSLEIEPRFYSVLSCASVNGVKQVVLAVIEQVADKDKDTKPDAGGRAGRDTQKKRKRKRPSFVIRRLYWV